MKNRIGKSASTIFGCFELPDYDSSEKSRHSISLDNKAEITENTVVEKASLPLLQNSISNNNKTEVKMCENDQECLQDISLLMENIQVSPEKRTESQISIISNILMQFIKFDLLPYSLKCMIASIGVFEVIENRDRIIISVTDDHLEYWRLIISGSVKILHNEKDNVILNAGDFIGFNLENTRTSYYDESCSYRSASQECQFIKVSKADFENYVSSKLKRSIRDSLDILNSEKTIETIFEGNLIQITSQERLIEMLFDDQYLDAEPYFLIDFFLIYKIIFSSYVDILTKIKECLKIPILISKAVSVLLIWINYSFEDFEDDYLYDFLSLTLTELSKTNSYLAECLITGYYRRCYAYQETYICSDDQKIPIKFSFRQIQYGDQSYMLEVYIEAVAKNECNKSCNLMQSDEVIYINDIKVRDLSISNLKKIITATQIFILIVKRCKLKYNFYKDKLRSLTPFIAESISLESFNNNQSGRHISMDYDSTLRLNFMKKKKRHPLKILKMLRSDTTKKTSPIPIVASVKKPELNTVRQSFSEKNIEFSDFSMFAMPKRDDADSSSIGSSGQVLRYFSHVLRVYSSENEVRYILISRSDTCNIIAYEVTHMFPVRRNSTILHTERQMDLPPSHRFSFFMFLSTFTKTGMKNSRLPGHANDLANKFPLGSKLFVAQSVTELKQTKELKNEMAAETEILFSNLNTMAIAKILTLLDFSRLSAIKPREFYRDIFKLKFLPPSENLNSFQKRCNQIITWVQYVVISEPVCKLRARIIKRFIQISDQCLRLGNFNAFFSIYSGLESTIISRLKTTWELVSQKYIKIHDNHTKYVNPAGNMGSYRSWLLKYSASFNCSNDHFLIPLIPIINKDITFINDCSDTYVDDNKINYHKLRMIAREIRKIYYFYDENFNLNEAFGCVPKLEDSPYLNVPVTSMIPFKPGSPIPLSHLLNEIIMLPDLNKTVMKNKEKATIVFDGTPSLNLKKFYDEYILCRKVLAHLGEIDTLNQLDESTTSKSYEYDPPIQNIQLQLCKQHRSDSLQDVSSSRSNKIADSVSVQSGDVHKSRSHDGSALGVLV